MKMKQDKNCIVKDCPNKKSQGVFFGDICGPCYHFITQGGKENANSTVFRNAYKIKLTKKEKWIVK